VLTADRVHPGNFVSTILTGFLLGFVQAPLEVFTVYVTLNAALRYLIHTRIDSDWGWVGRWLVLSPGHHRAHHALDMSKGNGNFGLLVLWDALFGTLRPPVGRAEPIGLSDGPKYRHGWWVVTDLLRDTRDTLRNVGGLLLGRLPR
jgi:sterol desaturase/sphingolipid hydroxylase (fatty acid hydroxylase superfamily)